jgi:hypothetical protein
MEACSYEKARYLRRENSPKSPLLNYSSEEYCYVYRNFTEPYTLAAKKYRFCAYKQEYGSARQCIRGWNCSKSK